MKLVNFLAWAASVVAAVLIILGTIAYIIDVRVFGANTIINYFNLANTFLLVVICCLIYRRLGQVEKK